MNNRIPRIPPHNRSPARDDLGTSPKGGHSIELAALFFVGSSRDAPVLALIEGRGRAS